MKRIITMALAVAALCIFTVCAAVAAPVSDTGDEWVNGNWVFQNKVTFDGETTLNDTMFAEDALVGTVTRIQNSTSSLSWAYGYGNMAQCEVGNVSDLTVTLPDITTAMLGYRVGFKLTRVEGFEKKLVVAPSTTDYIESTYGAYTTQETNNSLATQNGSWVEFMAMYNGTDYFWSVVGFNNSTGLDS